MASTGAQQVRIGTKCPRCAEPLAEPKTLQCGHNVCARCLDGLLREHNSRRVPCPVCGAPTPVPDAGLGTNREYACKVHAMAERRRAETEREEGDRARRARINRHECSGSGCAKRLSTEHLCVCLQCDGAHICLQCMSKEHRGHDWHTARELVVRHRQRWKDYKAANLETAMHSGQAHVAELDALHKQNADMLRRVGELMAEFKEDANIATRMVEKALREKIAAEEQTDYLAAEQHSGKHWARVFAGHFTDAECSVKQHNRAREKLLMANSNLEAIMNFLNDRSGANGNGVWPVE